MVFSSRKGDVNLVFVYAASFIMIAFVGFLVIKFAFSIGDTADTVEEVALFDTLDDEIVSVGSNFGSAFSRTLKVPRKYTEVCFMTATAACSNEVLQGLDDTANVAVFEQGNLIATKKIASFNLRGDSCQCKEVSGSVTLFFENDKNSIFVTISD